MKMKPILESTADKVLYCQFESSKARKDYLKNGRCVRFYGILSADVEKINRPEGVTTYLVDIDYWHLKRTIGDDAFNAIEEPSDTTTAKPDRHKAAKSIWYEIHLAKNFDHGMSYLAQTFFEDKCVRYDFLRISRIDPPEIKPSATNKDDAFCLCKLDEFDDSTIPQFDAFHVGQGNCSLAYSNTCGVIIDAGAGQPVTKKAYNKKKFRNDFKAIINRLSDLTMIVSHVDSDHWRILSWDSDILSKISFVCIPYGLNSIVFQDENIIKKCIHIKRARIRINGQLHVMSFRSNPKISDANGDCLVTVVSKNNKYSLAPGDYSYARMKTDSNSIINSLQMKKYASLIVPHHGSLESATDIVAPLAPNSSIAFFSAGTHALYGHPHVTTLNAHKTKSYINIENRTEQQIIRVNLL